METTEATEYESYLPLRLVSVYELLQRKQAVFFLFYLYAACCGRKSAF
jgi:hypothetical protein